MNMPTQLELHPDLSIQKFLIGEEKATLLVIDNLVAQPDALVNQAASLIFSPTGQGFPGIRALAPVSYQRFLLERLTPILVDNFQLPSNHLRFSMCHYSLVTTPPEKLSMVQRIPHVDSFDKNGLATVHYLFKKNLGGTAFYRHLKTAYEYVDEVRKSDYFKSLQEENNGPNLPGPVYINGDTALFKQIARRDGVFNRMLIYRRNSLHSGCIDENFKPDDNPLTGRLSLNSFIDPQ